MNRRNRTSLRLGLGGWVLQLACVVWMTPATQAQGSPPATEGMPSLDVVMMIDCSPSTKGTDPHNERIRAARFLIDYLTATSEAFGLNNRVAFANFGGTLGFSSPLTSLRENSRVGPPKSEQIPFTDFRPPLQFAVRELLQDSRGEEKRLVAVLFTDGRPALSGSSDADSRLDESGVSKYFSGKKLLPNDSLPSLPDLVAKLRGHPAELYVVAIGTDQVAGKAWRSVLAKDHYIELTSPRELALAYHEIFSSLLGFGSFKRVRLEEGVESNLGSAQDLGGLTMTVLKDGSDVKVSIADDRGEPVPTVVKGSGNRILEIYRSDLLAPKLPWRAKSIGGGALLLVNAEPLAVEVTPYTGMVERGLKISATTMQGRVVVDLPNLRLIGKLRGVGINEERRYPLRPMGGGKYRLTISDLKVAGSYTIQIEGSIDGKMAPLRVEAVPLRLVSVPRVLSVEGRRQTKSYGIYVGLREELPRDFEISAAACNGEGVCFGEASLLPTSRSPGQKSYYAELTNIDLNTVKTVEVRIERAGEPGIAVASLYEYPIAAAEGQTQGVTAGLFAVSLSLLAALAIAIVLLLLYWLPNRKVKAVLDRLELRVSSDRAIRIDRLLDHAAMVGEEQQFDHRIMVRATNEALTLVKREAPGIWPKAVAGLKRNKRIEIRRVAEEFAKEELRQSQNLLEDIARLCEAGVYGVAP